MPGFQTEFHHRFDLGYTAENTLFTFELFPVEPFFGFDSLYALSVYSLSCFVPFGFKRMDAMFFSNSKGFLFVMSTNANSSISTSLTISACNPKKHRHVITPSKTRTCQLATTMTSDKLVFGTRLDDICDRAASI